MFKLVLGMVVIEGGVKLYIKENKSRKLKYLCILNSAIADIL